MKRELLSLAVILGVATTTYAQPAIDGTLVGDESLYGPVLSQQNTNTQFGNSTFGDPANAYQGSEIDQIFGTVIDGHLHMLITGNLESNFNKLTLFVDSVAGGVNTIAGDELPGGVDGFCCGGFAPPRGNNTGGFGALERMNGWTFDTGFNADYLLIFNNGNEKVNPNTGDEVEFWAMSAHYADLTQGVNGDVVAAGMVLAPQGMPNVLRLPGGLLGDFPAVPDGFNEFRTMYGPALPGLSQGELIDRNYALGAGGCDDDTGAGCIAPELPFALDVNPDEIGEANPADNNSSSHRDYNNTIGLRMAIDNSNTGGVIGVGEEPWETTEDVSQVLTGVEFSIPLSALGNPTGDIRVTAFINGDGHNFASNQFGGTGVLAGNLASDVDLTIFAGDQFVTIANGAALDPADFDKNGMVDGNDFLIWQQNFPTSSGATPNTGDADGNGTVDGNDFLLWQAAFGSSSGAGSASVPEPASLLGLLLVSCGLAARRRW